MAKDLHSRHSTLFSALQHRITSVEQHRYDGWMNE